jgi:hypothetical protein
MAANGVKGQKKREVGRWKWEVGSGKREAGSWKLEDRSGK